MAIIKVKDDVVVALEVRRENGEIIRYLQYTEDRLGKFKGNP